MQKLYIEHEGKIVEPNEQFKHIMAITLDPTSNYQEGVVRCIKSRSGDLAFKGNVDRSELHKVKGNSFGNFEVSDRLIIKNEIEIIKELTGTDGDFIGLEDPDIWIDERSALMHLYFTIPISLPLDSKHKSRVHLGHAVGKDLNSLEMTMPVLMDNGEFKAKEVSIAPLNKKGFHYNLIESKDRIPEARCSIVQIAMAGDMGKSWQYGEIAFHPKEHNIPWIAGDASPGPLLPETFLDLGEGKRLGIINGREVGIKIDGQTKNGTFSVGLFIYDYENGKIDWVSPEPLIRDSEAKIITFASQFVETSEGEGILYAHVDDSFIRAYTLKAEWIKPLLP